jgi:hypothetical protein
MVHEIGNPGQPLNEGVTVIVAEIAELVVLVVKKEGIDALVPDAPNPMAVFELTQLNVVFTTELEKVIRAVFEPAHTV